MSEFGDLLKQIEDGRLGRNKGLGMGYERLGRYAGIRKRTMHLIFGPSGSGKSSYVHSSYILNPYESFKRGEVNKFKVILFSMERSKVYTLAKWLSRKIFLDKGILIQIPKMLGWWKEKLNDDEYRLISSYEWYIEDLLKYVDIIEGPQNPTGVYKYLKEYANRPENGATTKIDEFHSIYTPIDPGEIVIPIIDHQGLTKTEAGQSKKQAIDKLTEYLQISRDKWGYTPVIVSQVNRDLSNPIYQKMGSFEPTIDTIKESGSPAEAADYIFSIWDPRRYNTEDSSYNVENFVDIETGGNYFRSIKLLKNTYGEDQVRAGMAFHGATGTFKELLKPSDMDNFDYQSLFDGSYFLDKKK